MHLKNGSCVSAFCGGKSSSPTAIQDDENWFCTRNIPLCRWARTVSVGDAHCIVFDRKSVCTWYLNVPSLCQRIVITAAVVNGYFEIFGSVHDAQQQQLHCHYVYTWPVGFVVFMPLALPRARGSIIYSPILHTTHNTIDALNDILFTVFFFCLSLFFFFYLSHLFHCQPMFVPFVFWCNLKSVLFFCLDFYCHRKIKTKRIEMKHTHTPFDSILVLIENSI